MNNKKTIKVINCILSLVFSICLLFTFGIQTVRADAYLDFLSWLGSSVDRITTAENPDGVYQTSMIVIEYYNGSYEKAAVIEHGGSLGLGASSILCEGTNKKARTSAMTILVGHSRSTTAYVRNTNRNRSDYNEAVASGNSYNIPIAQATLPLFSSTGNTAHTFHMNHTDELAIASYRQN